MPSRKGSEQAITWLKSKMAEKDTLDAINAEVCYNVIMDLKKKKEKLGVIYHQTKVERDNALDEFWAASIRAVQAYALKEKGEKPK